MSAAARQALDSRQLADAESLAAAALVFDPRAARPRAVLGLALLRRSKSTEPPDLALQNRGDGETMLAHRLQPGDMLVGQLRATLLAETGHLSAAAKVAEECLAINNPSDASEYVELLAATAEWRYELGEETAATPLLWRLVRYRPDDSLAYVRLGSCVLAAATTSAEAEEAARVFARGSELAPGDDDALLAVASAWVRAASLARGEKNEAAATQHLAAANAACTAACGRFMNLAEARFRLGVIQELQGDPSAARKSYESALTLDQGHIGSLLNLAALMASEAPDSAAARALWRRAIEVDAAHGGLQARERKRVEALVK